MLPKKYVETKESEIQVHLPEQHRRFLDDIMERYGVPEINAEGDDIGGHMNFEVSSREIVREMVEEFAGTVMHLSTLFDEE